MDIMILLNDRDPLLTIGTSSDGRSNHEVVLLVLLDSTFESDSHRVAHFKRHARKNGCVIPLILRDYVIKDYSSWWPAKLPGKFKDHITAAPLPL